MTKKEKTEFIRNEIVKNLGDAAGGNSYVIRADRGMFWITHAHVGSGEPLAQWLEDRIETALNEIEIINQKK